MLIAVIVIAGLALLLSGFAIGVVLADWRHRAEVAQELVEVKADLRKTVADLQTLHNSTVQRISEIQDQLNAQEMKFAAKGRTTAWGSQSPQP